jgi:hypothetical protein
MWQARRYGLSSEQKAGIWRRLKAGESLHEIGRAFSKDHGSIHFLLSQHGGIAPAGRHRGQRALTLAEREDISRGVAPANPFPKGAYISITLRDNPHGPFLPSDR